MFKIEGVGRLYGHPVHYVDTKHFVMKLARFCHFKTDHTFYATLRTVLSPPSSYPKSRQYKTSISLRYPKVSSTLFPLVNVQRRGARAVAAWGGICPPRRAFAQLYFWIICFHSLQLTASTLTLKHLLQEQRWANYFQTEIIQRSAGVIHFSLHNLLTIKLYFI